MARPTSPLVPDLSPHRAAALAQVRRLAALPGVLDVVFELHEIGDAPSHVEVNAFGDDGLPVVPTETLLGPGLFPDASPPPPRPDDWDAEQKQHEARQKAWGKAYDVPFDWLRGVWAEATGQTPPASKAALPDGVPAGVVRLAGGRRDGRFLLDRDPKRSGWTPREDRTVWPPRRLEDLFRAFLPADFEPDRYVLPSTWTKGRFAWAETAPGAPPEAVPEVKAEAASALLTMAAVAPPQRQLARRAPIPKTWSEAGRRAAAQLAAQSYTPFDSAVRAILPLLFETGLAWAALPEASPLPGTDVLAAFARPDGSRAFLLRRRRPGPLPLSEEELFRMLEAKRLPKAFANGPFAWVEYAEEAGAEPLRTLDAVDEDGEPMPTLYVTAEADDVRTLVEQALAWVDDVYDAEGWAEAREAAELDAADVAFERRLKTPAARRLWARLTHLGILTFEPAAALAAGSPYLDPLAHHLDALTPLFGFSAAPPYHEDAFAVVRLKTQR